VAVVTGRRVSELAGLRFGDLEPTESGRVRVTWQRTKGDETYTDVLPPKISAFLLDYLGQVYDAWEDDPPPSDAAVWVSTSNHHHGGPISSQAIADICAKRLKISKVHRLRHTFAWTMEQKGAKLSEIQRRLGHKNIATTSLYLQALTNEENPYAEAIESAIGVEEKR
jgi:integrase